MTPAQHTNYLAAKAVSFAEAYLNRMHGSESLAHNADQMTRELLTMPDDVGVEKLATVTKLLVETMRRTSGATGAREERWRDVMAAFAKLARQESKELREGEQ